MLADLLRSLSHLLLPAPPPRPVPVRRTEPMTRPADRRG